MSELLADVSPKTTKAELMNRLRDAVRRLGRYEDERVARMQEIEERIHRQAKVYDLRQIMVSSTNEEWKESLEFLDSFEEYLPPSLARFRDGVALLVKEEGIEVKRAPAGDTEVSP